MDGLYGTHMVCRWYVDGIKGLHGTKRKIKILYHTQMATKKYKKFCTIQRWYKGFVWYSYGT